MTTIGLPSETKDGEKRVALTPSAVKAAVQDGHTFLVEQGAGTGAGFEDAAYEDAGASIVDGPDDVWAADLVVKVKEPQPAEYEYFRPDLTLFAYLHLAAEPELTEALVDSGITAYAFETLSQDGALPLLAPMSEIAGRTAAIVAAMHLSDREGGNGTLPGGAAGVPPAKAIVIGLGVAGTMAARGLQGLDAHVTGIDLDLQRLHGLALDRTLDSTIASIPTQVAEAVADADVVVGAALVPGTTAPIVVPEEMVASMDPGSVVVDLAIDQGGCIATSRPTSLSEPVFVEHGVVHYCVTNVPGQYPRTASAALSAAVTPRLLRLAADPEHADLSGALNVRGGEITHEAVKAAVG